MLIKVPVSWLREYVDITVPIDELALKLHVVFDLIERHMPRPFHHHLASFRPGTLCQFAKGCQFT